MCRRLHNISPCMPTHAWFGKPLQTCEGTVVLPTVSSYGIGCDRATSNISEPDCVTNTWYMKHKGNHTASISSRMLMLGCIAAGGQAPQQPCH